MNMSISENDGGALSWRSTVPWLCCHWCCRFIRCPSFHVIQEGQGVLLLALWCLALFNCMLSLDCRFSFPRFLLGLRITVQSLHSLKGPPIARLSAPLGLPCAFAASPLSPRSICLCAVPGLCLLSFRF